MHHPDCDCKYEACEPRTHTVNPVIVPLEEREIALPSQERYIAIAIKLYAKARRISLDEAAENVRDAAIFADDAPARQACKDAGLIRK